MNLYVGNIPFNTAENDLKTAFEEFGAVSSVKIITDRYTGQSRGFGFVEMENKDEALNAISSLDGTELSGRKIVVNEARPRESRD